MINIAISPFSIDDGESQLASTNECLLNFVFLGNLNSEVQKTWLSERPMEVGQHQQPVFGTNMFHSIHANRAIKSLTIRHFLQTDFLKLDAWEPDPGAGKHTL